MKLILQIAFRNLIRQKRRNALLALALVLGISVLVTASSFSAGITDIIMNKVIAMMMGHVQVSVQEKSIAKGAIVRDQAELEKLINENVTGVKTIRQNLTVWCRMIGNGKADNMIVIGINRKGARDDMQTIKLVEGDLEDFYNDENPALIYASRTNVLNVTIGDTISARFQTMHGQTETARFKVVGLIKPENIFADLGVLVDSEKLKAKMGLMTWETAGLQVIQTSTDKQMTLSNALKLQMALTPKIASLPLLVKSQSFFGLAPNVENLRYDRRSVSNGNFVPAHALSGINLDKDKLYINKSELVSLGKIGDKVKISYPTRFRGDRQIELKLASSPVDLPKGVALLHPETHRNNYYDYLPITLSANDMAILEKTIQASGVDQWGTAFVCDHILLRRSDTTKDITKKYAELNKNKWKGQVVDVSTMFETGEQMLQMEQALNFITFLAVIVIFTIVLIGVMNTLNLSIRERTREIGTVRSIGMSRNQVLALFVTEAGLLAVIASFVGVVFSYLLMFGLHMISFPTDSYMSFFLVDGRLHFVTKPFNVMFFSFLIIFMTTATAILPSRKAAKMKPSDAIRHYE